MQSIFEKDNITFSDSGGIISNVSSINLISSSNSHTLNYHNLSAINPSDVTCLNKLNVSNIELNDNLYVAGHSGLGSVSVFQDSSILANLQIGTPSQQHDLTVYGGVYLSEPDTETLIKLDTKYISELKSSLDTNEIRLLDSNNVAYTITSDYIKQATLVIDSRVDGDISAHHISASDIIVNDLTVTGKLKCLPEIVSSRIFFEAPKDIASYNSGMIAIAKATNTYWFIKFSTKVGLFKIKKRTALFLNKDEPRYVKTTGIELNAELKDLINTYNNKAFWEPLCFEQYDSSIFQCVLELDFE